MSNSSDLLGVAWSGLIARRIRTILIMLGPIVGVAAMVCAVGLTESAKGSLQQQLSKLGTSLIIAQAGGSFGSQNPTLPKNSVARVEKISTVVNASATTAMNGIVSLPSPGTTSYYDAFPVPVRAADLNLPSVLKVPLLQGRWLNKVDVKLRLHSAVLGEGVAHQYGYVPGETRSIQLNGIDFGVVGVLGSVTLTPSLDNAVFITQWAAKHVFHTNGLPNELYVRAKTGSTTATSKAVPAAVTLGGTTQLSVSVPSNVLQAAAKANHTLQEVAFYAGLLALAIGGLGIANVMSISVIQRSSEIGIRRAVGHGRSKIGAQFLLESLFVGVIGGLIGALLGVGIVYAASALAHWVPEVFYSEIPLWLMLAIAVSVVAGLIPSIKAARLEPLETLRLG